jgi:hypothetical protein
MTDGRQSTADGQTRVGHCKHDAAAVDVYVGRGPDGRAMGGTPIGDRGWLGNPYSVADADSRGAAVEAFRADFIARLERDETFRAAVRDLAGQTLGCWCQSLADDAPLCHAETIAEYADRLAAEDKG